MITTMNRHNIDRLIIFDNFQIDNNLPKFKQNPEKTAMFSEGVGFATDNIVSNSSVFMTQAGTIIGYNQNYHGMFTRFWYWISNKKKIAKEYCKRVKVQYVFENVLQNPEELKLFDEKNKEYDKLIENAKLTGQVALLEELLSNKDIKKFENQLVVLNLNKFISESNLLKFAENCEKGLKLDWIKNFTRIIPDEVIKSKIKCDENKLFDNYVVLYFDPENKATKMTKAEIEKAKDPILFGVMRGSRKLYFIGDWKDELCDLTFDQIATKLSEKETTLS